jgi:ribosomal protein L17
LTSLSREFIEQTTKKIETTFKKAETFKKAVAELIDIYDEISGAQR